jgi:ATP-binding cassette subfamily B protein
MMGPVEKAKDFRGSIKKLLNYIARHIRKVIFVWVLAAVSAVLAVAGPKVLGGATNKLVEGIQATISGTGGVDFGAIGAILLTVAGLYVLSALLMYIQGFIMSGVNMKVSYQLRKDINEKIHRLPISYFDKTTHGEVLSRITNDVDTISQNLGQSVTQLIAAVAMLIGSLVMMLSISVPLTLIALLIMPLSGVFVVAVVKASQKHFVAQQATLGHINGHIEEAYGGHNIVKAFGREKESAETFDLHNKKLYASGWKSQFLSGLMMPITGFIGNLGYVAVCLAGGYFAVNGAMTVGGIQSFIQYVRTFTQPMSQIAQISNVLQQTAAAAERVFAFLGEAEETADAPDALDIPEKSGEGRDVLFENVRFGYDPEKIIINDFSAHIKPGQTVAIVGPTGAGKTTVVKLLMRFYDLSGGSISVGGQDITRYRRNDSRAIFGMVLQDTWLFSGTIGDNIRYGRPDASDVEVQSAAAAAQADHFVRTLPDGYNMQLNEETGNVSQGQKQLLTIARAILADPEILILDEATSSVDTRTEALIQKAMKNLMKGRTSFIIAHRLSTIRNADLILVMRDGDIAEQGRHEELMAKNGVYAELYNSQFAS